MFYVIKSKGGVDLTEMEQKVLDAIINYINENGFGPSIRELRNTVGLKSTSTIHYYVKRLEEKGYIIRKGNSPRAIMVLKGGSYSKDINITITEEEFKTIVATIIARQESLKVRMKKYGTNDIDLIRLEELNLLFNKLLKYVDQVSECEE